MLQLAEKLDRINRAVGATVRWLALAMVLVQFGTVVLRYVYGISFIFMNETVLYLHATLFMLAAGYTLLVDGHVRVDIFYGLLGSRGKARIDIFGALCFLIPSTAMIGWFSWPSVRNSWSIMEGAISVGGIPASFLLKSLIPAFCVLLIIQGLACIMRDIARLREEKPAA
ncbi:TRAP transporter small permease subunit [Nitratireductor kimnyeongensis]|uniref:TRAP transporter small permease protein n=1 Tax=Nitratireductor kimnyeongensis TaxID=430679 RepID=A0ABW0TA21_9HYPH|nr:TRAP transporter small permease subunit [Nitratireductor kimnyeongensis]QZZ36566.1 TRAP transporter small permease subunit [Nitratireductor kimnyeongensis]